MFLSTSFASFFRAAFCILLCWFVSLLWTQSLLPRPFIVSTIAVGCMMSSATTFSGGLLLTNRGLNSVPIASLPFIRCVHNCIFFCDGIYMPIVSTSKTPVDVRADTVVKAKLAQLGNSLPQIKTIMIARNLATSPTIRERNTPFDLYLLQRVTITLERCGVQSAAAVNNKQRRRQLLVLIHRIFGAMAWHA